MIVGEQLAYARSAIVPVLVGEQGGVLPLLGHIDEGGQVGGDDGAACGHGLGKHDAETLTAGLRRHIDVERLVEPSLVVIIHTPQKFEMLKQPLAVFAFEDGLLGILTAVADHQEPRTRVLAQHLLCGVDEHREPLALLFKAPQEPDRGVFRSALPLRVGRGPQIRGTVDAVGDDGSADVFGQIMVCGAAGRRGDEDRTAQRREIRPQVSFEDVQSPRIRFDARMEGGDHGWRVMHDERLMAD